MKMLLLVLPNNCNHQFNIQFYCCHPFFFINIKFKYPTYYVHIRSQRWSPDDAWWWVKIPWRSYSRVFVLRFAKTVGNENLVFPCSVVSVSHHINYKPFLNIFGVLKSWTFFFLWITKIFSVEEQWPWHIIWLIQLEALWYLNHIGEIRESTVAVEDLTQALIPLKHAFAVWVV